MELFELHRHGAVVVDSLYRPSASCLHCNRLSFSVPMCEE